VAVDVVLPKVDMDMTEGTIAVWHVAEGDQVQKGQPLFDMETSKAVMEVEAPASGRIRGLAPLTGEPVAVGTPVAWIDADDEQTPSGASGSDDDARPLVRESASVAARQTVASAPATVEAEERSVRPDGDEGIRATPLARNLARTHGIALQAIAGSGPRGRVVAADVEARAATQDEPAVPFTPTRRLVAQRLAESARNAPHFYLVAHIDMAALVERVQRATPALLAATGAKPSLTAILVHLVARVLREHPVLNASVEGQATRLHRRAHVGIAMDRDGDLVVPVLRDAATRPLADIVQEYARLRESVRARTLLPHEMRGATFTITNLGMYGVDAFTAIIDPPQSAILAVGRIVDTPVGRDGEIVLRPVATFTLSSDHRIVDGTAAARFMADLRRSIEDPPPLA
jgi:pyruvate dehydrogenase E2 component (dihydrolipoamide acetyltransferase)